MAYGVHGVVLVLALLYLDPSIGAKRKWSYEPGEDGPSKWYEEYEGCNGKSQSPINLDNNLAQYDSKLEEFTFEGYEDASGFRMTLENDGRTVKVTMLEENRPHKISGGKLPGKYRIAQYHFHWGSDDSKGSEHTLNGRGYPLELHLVHYAEKYDATSGLGEAVDKNEGLAVLGILFEIGEVHNEKFDAIIGHFVNITAEDTEVELGAFKLKHLLPDELEKYWRYSGSLTTPACYESVIWTVFQKTVKISQSQMQQFRTLTYVNNNTEVMPMVDTFRPVQKLEGRVVYTSASVSGATSVVCNKSAYVVILTCLLVKLFLSEEQ